MNYFFSRTGGGGVWNLEMSLGFSPEVQHAFLYRKRGPSHYQNDALTNSANQPNLRFLRTFSCLNVEAYYIQSFWQFDGQPAQAGQPSGLRRCAHVALQFCWSEFESHNIAKRKKRKFCSEIFWHWQVSIPETSARYVTVPKTDAVDRSATLTNKLHVLRIVS